MRGNIAYLKGECLPLPAQRAYHVKEVQVELSKPLHLSPGWQSVSGDFRLLTLRRLPT
jgi:hypothetical protein